MRKKKNDEMQKMLEREQNGNKQQTAINPNAKPMTAEEARAKFKIR